MQLTSLILVSELGSIPSALHSHYTNNVQVNITAHINYTTILLSLDPFQLLLHSVARVNFLKGELDHIIPLFKSLQWLPIVLGIKANS